MNVGELIELLKKEDSKKRVVIDSYEGGFSDILTTSKVKLKLNVNSQYFYGPDEEVKTAEDETAILIKDKENPLSN